MYASAKGEQLTGDEVAGLLRPEDIGREAIQMCKYFRSLSPEHQKLELVKTLARTEPKD